MRAASRMTASAVVGSLGLLCLASIGVAQSTPDVRPVAHIASVAAGSIQGTVQDEHGSPISGATISALGPTPAFAVSDRVGRFELRTLSPGPYLLRAHSSGFVASRGQIVDVRPSARSASSIALHHAAVPGSASSYPIAAAGIGAVPETAGTPADATGTTGTAAISDDHGDVAWRLRHLRRGVLKD